MVMAQKLLPFFWKRSGYYLLATTLQTYERHRQDQNAQIHKAIQRKYRLLNLERPQWAVIPRSFEVVVNVSATVE